MSLRKSAINENIHGARGLFSFMVFVYHVSNSGLPTFYGIAGSLFEIYALKSLRFGVELFFGISGIVIVGALTRAETIASFAWDRFTRIYPVLWVTLIVIIGLALVAGDPRHVLVNPFEVAANFLTLPPFFQVAMLNPAAWSLGYELTFYILCALAWWMRGRGIRSWLAIAVAAGVVLVCLFPRGLLIVSGVLIANGLLRQSPIVTAARFPGVALVGFLLAWTWLDLSTPAGVMIFSPAEQPWPVWLRLLPLILFAGLLGTIALLGITQGNGIICRLLTSRSMMWLGTISYSFYLWHPVIMATVKQGFYRLGIPALTGPFSQLAFGVLALPPSLLVAHYSQIWLETRLTKKLRRIGPGGRRATPPTTTVAEQIVAEPNQS